MFSFGVDTVNVYTKTEGFYLFNYIKERKEREKKQKTLVYFLRESVCVEKQKKKKLQKQRAVE